MERTFESRLNELSGMRQSGKLSLRLAGELDALRQGQNQWEDYKKKSARRAYQQRQNRRASIERRFARDNKS